MAGVSRIWKFANSNFLREYEVDLLGPAFDFLRFFTTSFELRAVDCGVFCPLSPRPVLDVLTPLSDCRQEPVEKMERRYRIGIGWISTTRFSVVGFYVRLISVSFSGSLFRLPRRGLPRPTALFSGYHAEGYYAHTDAFKLTGYHVCRVTTPELPLSKQTSGYRQVITPAGSF